MTRCGHLPWGPYAEAQAGNLYLQKRADVRRFPRRVNLLRAIALTPDDTAVLLHQAIEEMR